MKKTVYLCLCFNLLASVAYAGDISKGEASAAVCAGCHSGTSPGVSASEAFPNLAGQKQSYLAKQIKAFKAGTRKDPTMNAMVSSLSDSDIENISSYFSSLKN